MSNDDLKAVYGPAARYSEHTCGDTIVYTQEDLFYTGTILYIAARSSFLVESSISLQKYIVLPTYDDAFPDSISPANIVIDDEVAPG